MDQAKVYTIGIGVLMVRATILLSECFFNEIGIYILRFFFLLGRNRQFKYNCRKVCHTPQSVDFCLI